MPTPAGYQTPTTAIDFLTFNETIVDGSNGVATTAPPPTVHNRVYVEVHNRGRDRRQTCKSWSPSPTLRPASPCPAGYTADVTAGNPLSGPNWTTLGYLTIPQLSAGLPQIAHFDLPSTSLPLPASLPGNSHYCMVAILHSASDPFTNTQRNVDLLTLADRKVAQKNLHIVQFVGTPPPPGIGTGTWLMLLVGAETRSKKPRLIDLRIDATGFPGTLHFALPQPLFPKDPARQAKGFSARTNQLIQRWTERHLQDAERPVPHGEVPRGAVPAARHVDEGRRRPGSPDDAGRSSRRPPRPDRRPSRNHAVFARVDPPKGTKVGASFSFDISEHESATGQLLGGSRYHVEVVPTDNNR